MQIANFQTRRILIENGSSANILFWDAFIKMGIDLDRLRPAPMPLKGFMGDVVHLAGAITLSILAGMALRTATTMTDFLVMKASSSYNAILGRPTLNSLKAMTSTFHLKVKFPTDSGVSEIRGEQILAQECYDREMRHEARVVAAIEAPKEAPTPGLPQVLTEWDREIRDKQALRQAASNEQLELVVVDQLEPGRQVRIGIRMGQV
ncbi:uncharacterized protein LOC121265714 [Juglans microcarpa x Juglans regia]|uniref:uncharacterized protein LOC121265714 n=1 Tax=Juglans microcarpa x Juglans regia TaxID=2249226 RepID=UPI001B7EF499|nr:uncharacterized protein LOC121265714 [Juglans microcarpa x Juglans regia]